MNQLPLELGSFAVLPLEPAWHIPAIENPREVALGYVAKLLERGYTERNALEEVRLGSTGVDGLGYEIQRGVIFVPLIGPSRYRFKFAELAAEARASANSGAR